MSDINVGNQVQLDKRRGKVLSKSRIDGSIRVEFEDGKIEIIAESRLRRIFPNWKLKRVEERARWLAAFERWKKGELITSIKAEGKRLPA